MVEPPAPAPALVVGPFPVVVPVPWEVVAPAPFPLEVVVVAWLVGGTPAIVHFSPEPILTPTIYLRFSKQTKKKKKKKKKKKQAKTSQTLGSQEQGKLVNQKLQLGNLSLQLGGAVLFFGSKIDDARHLCIGHSVITRHIDNSGSRGSNGGGSNRHSGFGRLNCRLRIRWLGVSDLFQRHCYCSIFPDLFFFQKTLMGSTGLGSTGFGSTGLGSTGLGSTAFTEDHKKTKKTSKKKKKMKTLMGSAGL